MSHMQVQIVYDLWLEIEGDGTEFVPIDITALFQRTVGPGWRIDECMVGWDEAVAAVKDYVEMLPSMITEISCRKGWGVRLSAPGYMDRTDWSVFKTKAEAKAHADEYLTDGEDV